MGLEEVSPEVLISGVAITVLALALGGYFVVRRHRKSQALKNDIGQATSMVGAYDAERVRRDTERAKRKKRS